MRLIIIPLIAMLLITPILGQTENPECQKARDALAQETTKLNNFLNNSTANTANGLEDQLKWGVKVSEATVSRVCFSLTG